MTSASISNRNHNASGLYAISSNGNSASAGNSDISSRLNLGVSRGAHNVGSKTDVGYVREHNEDSLLVRPPLFAVCDGMGGHKAGEVASDIAVRVLAARAPRQSDAEGLKNAVEQANLSIIHAVHEGEGREGMGTTCTAAILEDERLTIAQVGDSRAYLLHNGSLQQITRDHSLVADLIDQGEITPEEARNHPWRSYITRALGLDPRVEPDIYELNISTGDRLMLCSDGLYSMVRDDKIADILNRTPDPQKAADRLVKAALDAGGSDNVTVIVIDATVTSERSMKKITRKAKFSAAIIIGLLAAILIGAAIGFNVLVSTSAYLGEVDGRVAIYQGIPGDIAGMSFSRLDEVSDVAISDLQPGVARRIQSLDIRCDSIQSARDLVNGYRSDLGLATNHPGAEDTNANTAASADSDGASEDTGSDKTGEADDTQGGTQNV